MGANQACVPDPARERERQDKIKETGAEKGNEGDGQQNAGQSQKSIGQVHIDDGISKSTIKAGETSCEETDTERDGHNGEGNEQRDARAE